eukprot:11225268-Lingulodinium_polyedra.AAC.1
MRPTYVAVKMVVDGRPQRVTHDGGGDDDGVDEDEVGMFNMTMCSMVLAFTISMAISMVMIMRMSMMTMIMTM